MSNFTEGCDDLDYARYLERPKIGYPDNYDTDDYCLSGISARMFDEHIEGDLKNRTIRAAISYNDIYNGKNVYLRRESDLLKLDKFIRDNMPTDALFNCKTNRTRLIMNSAYLDDKAEWTPSISKFAGKGVYSIKLDFFGDVIFNPVAWKVLLLDEVIGMTPEAMELSQDELDKEEVRLYRESLLKD